jgi:DNA-binding LacI/PurR family transcriptional regulator/serine/threonine protein phosphatase PrpC
MAGPDAAPTICMVLSEHLTNHYAGPLAQGAVAAAAKLGVRLVLYSPLNILMDRRDLTAAELPLLPRNADAYLLPSNVADEVFAPLRRKGAPLLTYAGVRPGLPSIGPDNRAGARAATAHLIAHGRRRIAHLTGLPDSDESHERHAGYREALEAAGLPYDERLVAAGCFRVQEAEDATAEWLRQGLRFDALFAANDLEARGAMDVLARAGLRVPDDVAVVGFDDSIGSDALNPPLSSVRQSAFQLGWDALTLLAARTPLPARTLVPVGLVTRRSCGCTPTPAAGDWAAALADLMGAGQGPLVTPAQAQAWVAPLGRALERGEWQAALDHALAEAFAQRWQPWALRSYLRHWQHQAPDPAAALVLVNAAKDRLDDTLDQRRLGSQIARGRRLDAITYVIDLLREYGYEQSSEAALRYMVNSGPQSSLIVQRVASDTLSALRVDARAGAETWQGDVDAFPPPAWLAPGDTMLLMPIDAGPQQTQLVGVVEHGGPEHLELNDLLLRSINTYRSVTTLHETLRELDAARSVQLSLLPRRSPVSAEYDIAGATRAARQVGGDLYGYYERPGGALAVALGDVAGKGLPAALLMSACVTALAGTIPAGLAPGLTLSQIHLVLQPSVGPGQNAALCLVYLDGDVARIANAGSIAPFVCAANGVRTVEVGGLPLGTPLSGMRSYEEAELQLAPGELVVLVSDGIVEAMNERHEMYGFSRLERTLAAGPRTSAEAMLAHILADVAAFAGDTEAHDDMAIVVVRRRVGVSGENPVLP